MAPIANAFAAAFDATSSGIHGYLALLYLGDDVAETVVNRIARDVGAPAAPEHFGQLMTSRLPFFAAMAHP